MRVHRLPSLTNFGKEGSLAALRYSVAEDSPLIALAVRMVKSASAICAACNGWALMVPRLGFGAAWSTGVVTLACMCAPLS